MRIYKTIFFVEDNVHETGGERTAEIEMRSSFVRTNIRFLAPRGITLDYIEEIDLDAYIAELQRKREELQQAFDYHDGNHCDCNDDDYVGRPYAEWSGTGENCAQAMMLGLHEEEVSDQIRKLEQLRDQLHRT